jgi:hypothetical protein
MLRIFLDHGRFTVAVVSLGFSVLFFSGWAGVALNKKKKKKKKRCSGIVAVSPLLLLFWVFVFCFFFLSGSALP